MNSIVENLQRVREKMGQAAAKVGRAVEDIELVAITKTHPAERVREAIEAGQTLFGESRVQEAQLIPTADNPPRCLTFFRLRPNGQPNRLSGIKPRCDKSFVGNKSG